MTSQPINASSTPIHFPAAGRRIAIGDIHGEADSLVALLTKLDIQMDDTVILLGDCINRGPKTNEVLERLIDLSNRCRLIGVLGVMYCFGAMVPTRTPVG